MKLDEIGGEQIATYAAYRQANKLRVSSINRELQVLRRMLRLAVEWGVVERAVKVKMLPGEHHRERVVTLNEEARYLAAALEPLASVVTVLVDTGMRPEECFRLRWESITWANGRHGTLLVTHGKTAAARRVLPLTPRVRAVLEGRWEGQGRPLEGWVWPSGTRSGHIESCTPQEAAQEGSGGKQGASVCPVHAAPHIPHPSGGEWCDTWTLARIAGHSNVGMSARYVHPSEDAVLAAMDRLGGHNSGHSAELPETGSEAAKQLTA